MSTPTMNHGSHTHPQQQQTEQQINETPHIRSNSDNTPHGSLTRSDSTSTVILEDEEAPSRRRSRQPTQPPSLLTSLSTQLRSILKTSGLFNKDLESSDRWNELFASGNGFALQQLLSEAGVNDVNIDMNELKKLDSIKMPDYRTLSEFLRSESFDQLMATAANNPGMLPDPLAMPCSSSSFCELRPVSPELTTDSNFPVHPPTRPSSSMVTSDPNALTAFEHDHAFLSKRTPAADSRRKSSRLRSRAAGPMASEGDVARSSRQRNVNRAKDIETQGDLNYYLERRRKNNEASKTSRAVRKQKFGNMDSQCEEYERVNTELRMRIATLESVTTSLKSGLVNNFQRKPAV